MIEKEQYIERSICFHSFHEWVFGRCWRGQSYLLIRCCARIPSKLFGSKELPLRLCMSTKKVTCRYKPNAVIFFRVVMDDELVRTLSMIKASLSLWIYGIDLFLSLISTPYFLNSRTKLLIQQLFFVIHICEFCLRRGMICFRHDDTKLLLWLSILKCLVTLVTAEVFEFFWSMILTRDTLVVVCNIYGYRIEVQSTMYCYIP